MIDLMSEICAFGGGILSLIGALITARAVFVSEDQALWIGIPRVASSDREGQLRNPNVQNLLTGSKAAKHGLYWIAAGIFLQTVPSAIDLLGRIIGSLSAG